MEFRLYLELDSTNFGVTIVNLDYLIHSRLTDECCKAIKGILSIFLLQRSSRGHEGHHGPAVVLGLAGGARGLI